MKQTEVKVSLLILFMPWLFFIPIGLPVLSHVLTPRTKATEVSILCDLHQCKRSTGQLVSLLPVGFHLRLDCSFSGLVCVFLQHLFIYLHCPQLAQC